MTAADRITALARLLDGTSIGLLELTTAEGTILIRRDDAAEIMPACAPDVAPLVVRAPLAGVFHPCHPAQDMALAMPGRMVAADEAVGLIQVGAVLIHVVAPAAGVIEDVTAEAGALVGFGTPLLRITGVHG